jgi:hypothetical protein
LERCVDVWFVDWMRIVMRVAVPVPEPKRIWLEHAVSENGFSSRTVVRVKQEPEQLFVVCFRG